MNVTLEALEAIPECATCGETRFRRASLFEQPTTDTIEVEPESEPEWLHRTRDRLVADGRKGQFLAFESDDGASVVPVSEGWSRIGRSVSAEIRLDDPTVSRRHAVVVRTPQGGLRVLDDRSLNGVFVNGESVDWGRLLDGDELAIGRYRLHVIDTSATAAGADIPLHAVNG